MFKQKRACLCLHVQTNLSGNCSDHGDHVSWWCSSFRQVKYGWPRLLILIYGVIVNSWPRFLILTFLQCDWSSDNSYRSLYGFMGAIERTKNGDRWWIIDRKHPSPPVISKDFFFVKLCFVYVTKSLKFYINRVSK